MRMRGASWCGMGIMLAALASSAGALAEEPSKSVTADASMSAVTDKRGQQVRFGVTSLDRDPATRELAAAIQEILRRSGFEVLDESALSAALAQRRAAAVPSELMDRFLEGSANAPEGINSFFYDDLRQAIAKLSPWFNFVVEHPQVLSRRVDMGASAYESGVVLMRTYGAKKQAEEMRAIAILLTRTFPTMLPSTKTSPPDIKEYVQRVREESLDPGTTLTLRLDASESRCALFINGLPAKSDEPYRVDAKYTYYLRADCGDREAAIWAWRPTPGRASEVLLGGEPPGKLEMPDASTESRAEIERHLRFIRSWSGTDVVIGVSRRAGLATEEGALLVRVEQQRAPLWSDSPGKELLTRTLPRLLPDYKLVIEDPDMFGAPAADDTVDVSARQQRRAHHSSSRVAPGVTLGLGLVAGGVGGYLAWSGQQGLNRALCSEANAARDVSRCQSVSDGYRYEDLGSDPTSQQEELQVRYEAWELRRNAGFAAAGVGGALLIGGTIWWVRRSRSRAEQAPVEETVSLGAGPTSVSVRVLF